MARNIFLLPPLADVSGRLAPPNVKVGAGAVVDSTGFESAGLVWAGLVSAIFSAEEAVLLPPGAAATTGAAASRADAGALAAPALEAGDPALESVELSIDGVIEELAGSAEFTALSIAAFAVVPEELAAAETVVWT